MKTIPLTKGAVALVDDEDYDRLAQHKWYINHGYAVRHKTIFTNQRKRVYMHREIIDIKPGYECDHIDCNKINNQKSNLRQATHSENVANQMPRVGTSSRYKGVFRDGKKWRARIRINNKPISLGTFIYEIDAAKAYDEAAIKHFGKFARTNKAKTIQDNSKQ